MIERQMNISLTQFIGYRSGLKNMEEVVAFSEQQQQNRNQETADTGHSKNALHEFLGNAQVSKFEKNNKYLLNFILLIEIEILIKHKSKKMIECSHKFYFLF